MIYLLVDFQKNEKVKSYTRLSKGRLITVKQHARDGGRKEQLNEQQDKDLRNKVNTGAIVGGTLALAGLSLVGISAATKQVIQTKYAQNINKAAARIEKASPITDFKKYSKYNPSTITDFNKYDNIVITTGGFTGALGHSANDLRANLARKYRKSLVLSVENKEFDTASTDFLQRAKATPDLLFKSAINGNKTAEDLAEVAYNIRKQTDKPITFIATSGGGMAIKNAQEITDKLNVKNISGIGLGSPTFALAQPKSPYISVMSGNDLFQLTPAVNKKDIVRVRGTFDTSRVYGLSITERLKIKAMEHNHRSYLRNPEVIKILDKVINR
jgi:hypothetical protein